MSSATHPCAQGDDRPTALPAVLIAGVLLGLLSTDVSACTVTKRADAVADGQILIPDEMRPDIMLHQGSNGRSGLQFNNCPPVQRIDIDSIPAMPGLTYVRNIRHHEEDYPAFGWHPTSPLIVFNLHKYSPGAPPGGANTPFRADQANRIQVTTGFGGRFTMDLNLGYTIYSRGGPMSSVDPVMLSAVTTTPGFPGNGPMHHSLSFSLVIPARTCTLSDTNLQLAPVTANALLRVGQSAGEMPLRVKMQCPRDGIRVDLTLRDALDRSNTGSALTPVPGHGSAGIAVQLMRDNAPVRLGSTWTPPLPHAGEQTIDLAARYLRTAGALQPGTVEGQAILTADYR